jgi:hypothetical protein
LLGACDRKPVTTKPSEISAYPSESRAIFFELLRPTFALAMEFLIVLVTTVDALLGALLMLPLLLPVVFHSAHSARRTKGLLILNSTLSPPQEGHAVFRKVSLDICMWPQPMPRQASQFMTFTSIGSEIA